MICVSLSHMTTKDNIYTKSRTIFDSFSNQQEAVHKTSLLIWQETQIYFFMSVQKKREDQRVEYIH